MASPVYTASQQAHAQVLLERSKRWARGVRNRDGLAFVTFASSRLGKDGQPVYYRATESACNCPSFNYRLACSHQLAVKIEAEQARESVGPRSALDRMNELMSAQLVDAF